MRAYSQQDAECDHNFAPRISEEAYNRQKYYDQLDGCERPGNIIRQKIDQMELSRALNTKRRQIKLEERRHKNRGPDSSLSISNHGSAISKIFSQNSRITTFANKISNLEDIANITETQNKNLKEQNKFLLEKLKKMKQKESKFTQIVQKAKKYKNLYQETLGQLQLTREECSVYKKSAQELKNIVLNDVKKLEQEILIAALRHEDGDYSEKSQSFSKNQTEQTKEEPDIGIHNYI